MNKLNYTTILLSIFCLSLLYLLYDVFTYTTHPSQTGVCCAITIEQHDDYHSTVHYWSSNSQESFDMHVSVEYPDVDYTTEEQLDAEVMYAVHQMQELCYHNHYGQ